MWRLILFLALSLYQVSVKADAGKRPAADKQEHNASLDSMLGGLEQELQDLGIPTVPKGHCASCQKPIAGKVGGAEMLVLWALRMPESTFPYCKIVLSPCSPAPFSC